MWYVDLDKLFIKQANAYALMNQNINLNKDPLSYYNESDANKDAFQTIWDLFANWNFDPTTEWTINSTASDTIFAPL
jgi:hypothetical protein